MEFAVGIGAFVASSIALVITAVVSIRQTQAQQHARTAEHRVQWCDEFRRDMRDYLAAVSLFYDTGEQAGWAEEKADAELLKIREERKAMIRSAEASIGLRLNPVVALDQDIALRAKKGNVANAGGVGEAYSDGDEARNIEGGDNAEVEKDKPEKDINAERREKSESAELGLLLCPCCIREAQESDSSTGTGQSREGAGSRALCPLLSGKDCLSMLECQVNAGGLADLEVFGPKNQRWDDLVDEDESIAEASRICAEAFLPTCMHKLTRIIGVKGNLAGNAGKGENACDASVASGPVTMPAEKVFDYERGVLGDSYANPGEGEVLFNRCYEGVSGMARSILKSEWERTKEELGTRRKTNEGRWTHCGWFWFGVVAALLISLLVLQFGRTFDNLFAGVAPLVCATVAFLGTAIVCGSYKENRICSSEKSNRPRLGICGVLLSTTAGISLVFFLAAIVQFSLLANTCPCSSDELDVLRFLAVANSVLFIASGILVGMGQKGSRD